MSSHIISSFIYIFVYPFSDHTFRFYAAWHKLCQPSSADDETASSLPRQSSTYNGTPLPARPSLPLVPRRPYATPMNPARGHDGHLYPSRLTLPSATSSMPKCRLGMSQNFTVLSPSRWISCASSRCGNVFVILFHAR